MSIPLMLAIYFFRWMSSPTIFSKESTNLISRQRWSWVWQKRSLAPNWQSPQSMVLLILKWALAQALEIQWCWNIREFQSLTLQKTTILNFSRVTISFLSRLDYPKKALKKCKTFLNKWCKMKKTIKMRTMHIKPNYVNREKLKWVPRWIINDLRLRHNKNQNNQTKMRNKARLILQVL